jgi:signal transduction histidine kinase
MASRLPEGGTLSPEVFEHRHHLLQGVLALHVPGLAVFALARGVDPLHALAASVAVPGACLLLSTWARGRRVRAVLVTAGLLWCSAALVSFAGGSTEARFHVFVVLAAVSLYQDWVPLAFTIAYAILGNGLMGRSAALFGVGTAEQGHPWTWAAVEGAAILGAAVALLVGWKESELERNRSSGLARDLTHAEDTAEQRRIVANLLVSLARRNQALLERQLDMVDRLEAGEEDPATLSDLFRLDHLATRMRRNAESLLVLAGNEPLRTWRDAIPASEVARGASAEIEDYPRVDVVVTDDPTVVGHAVADVAHLLAELLENAAVYSPPDVRVLVRGRFGPEGYELRVEDGGLGMSAGDRAAWNARFGAPPELDPDVFGTLGLHVVARLAARHAIAVRLEPGVPEGTTVVVVLPPALVSGPIAPAVPDRAAVAPPRRGRHWRTTGPARATPGPEEAPGSAEGALEAGAAAPGRADGPLTGAEAARLDAERRFLGSDPRAPATTGREPSHSLMDPRHPAGRALRPAGGTSALDQRVPQTHLAPGIAATSPVPPRRRAGGPDPDRTRDRLQAFQRGVRDGRRTAEAPSAGSAPGPTDPLDQGRPHGGGDEP